MEQTELGMQYMLRRAEVAEVADTLAEALDEDLRENADMFDRTRTTFSGNPHPNATMRTLERALAARDLPFLHLLSALLLVGGDLVLGLCDFSTPADFVSAVAAEYALLEEKEQDAVHLARRLTEPKAEHQQKRLRAAMREMERAGY